MERLSTNWAGNITFGASHVQQPTSLAQVQHLVARSPRVRALGTAHSFNDIADGPGTLMSLASLPHMMQMDTSRAQVRIGAGVRYAELGRFLHQRGYALPNLGSLPHISIAGSCATATHGSGDSNSALCTSVAALEMVTTEGDIVLLNRETAGTWFNGTVVALGALGIVVSLTLDVVPTFAVGQYVYEGLPFDIVREHFYDIVSSGYSVSLFTDWRSDQITQVWIKRRVDDPRPCSIDPDWFTATPADGQRHPAGLSPAGCTQQMGVPGPWYDRLPHFRPDAAPSSSGAELQSEYVVARRHAVAALDAVRNLSSRIGPLVQTCEIRTVAADEHWLSPIYARDSVGIHFTWVNNAEAVWQTLALVERELAPFDARPHWGKLFTTPPDVLASRYPRLADFRDLACHYDPGGKFRNDFVNRYVFDGSK